MNHILNAEKIKKKTILKLIAKKFYYYKDLFTHKDINTYINGVV